ncbi:MAG TPA: DUF2950 domain-containing protein [Bryobacteraceae bacterium]|nr:DUF2950 domain-containing protein [Bryobacteraceae bacterium]
MRMISSTSIALLVSTSVWAQQPKTFSSPEEAAKALVQAANQPGLPPLLEIFGADSKDLFPTDEEGQALRGAFVQAAAKKVQIDADPTHLGRAIIEVGEKGWPFPVPLMPTKDGRWKFDIEEGRNEVLARRLGANELAAITVVAGYVEAQQEYASIDRNGDGVLEYAQRILSTPGQKDGLYWDGSDSPVAGVITKSIADGFQAGTLQAYRGYYFRILKSQGPAAEGGAANYVVKNKWMIGGFALLAWPEKYGVTGVRTFIVNYSGVIYEKDLGASTGQLAPAIRSFNPDSSWRVVFDVDMDESGD